MTRRNLEAYRAARDAMLDCLDEGSVSADGLQAMRAAMANLAPNRSAFGQDRYDELMELLEAVEQLPRHEPVFIRHEPVLGHEHRRRMRPYRQVPFPYQLLKWDPAWLFVLFLFAGGFAFKPLWLVAGIIVLVRCVVWMGFRFPMTTIFFTGFLQGLFGSRRRW